MSEDNGTTVRVQDLSLKMLSGVVGDDLTPSEDRAISWGSPRLEIRREPLTYQAHLVPDGCFPTGFRAIEVGEQRSYIADLVRYKNNGDQECESRLLRHQQEMDVVLETRKQNLHPFAEMEQRNVDWSATSMGDFSPPLWLIEQFATAPRPGRVLAAAMPSFDLPVGWSSVNIPRLTTGTLTGAQAALNDPAAEQSLADAAITAQVTTIAGNETVPVQMLDQSPVGAHFDWVVFTDMESSYNEQLELQLIAGTGIGQQQLGILNNLVTTPYNAALAPPTATATSMYQYFGEAVAAVGHNRRMPPELWLMNTSRAAWIASSEDTANRPLVLANQQGPGNWDLLTYPVALDDAIQPVYGTTANQDVVIICRPSDWVLLESDIHTNVMFEPESGILAARCQLRRYLCAPCRYPGGHAALYNSVGMIPVSSF
jgi:hypothetical protein